MTTRRIGPAAAMVAVLALPGCDDAPTMLVPNQAPSVELSGGAIRDTEHAFIATLRWTGSDPDGRVEFYRYAVDDTADADEDWFETTATELTLQFSAPDSSRVDTMFIPPSPDPIERHVFQGAHTFFVRAVDNDGALSPIACTSFTSETFAPVTEIVDPDPRAPISTGSRLSVSWIGTDPDGTREPVGYSWRLVQVDNAISIAAEEIEAVLYDPAAGPDWSPFQTETTVTLENLTLPADYVFGVRAVDEVGAVEPRIRAASAPGPINAVRLRAGPQPLRLTVRNGFKAFAYPRRVAHEDNSFQIPAGIAVLFEWVAESSWTEDFVYSYGIDLEDLGDTNPDWAAESADLTSVLVEFPVTAGNEEHELFVRVRDPDGTTLIADARLIVVPFRSERDVLYVDDWFGEDLAGREHPELGSECTRVSAGGLIPDDQISSSDRPHDRCHDATLRGWIESALDRAGHPEWVVDRYEVLDRRSGDALEQPVSIDSTSQPYRVLTGRVTLETLSSYKLVIWSHRNNAGSQWAVMNTAGNDNLVAAYLAAGGDVWMFGSGVFHRARGDEVFPFYGYRDRDFAFQFLKIRSIFDGEDCTDGCFQTVTRNPLDALTHGFEGAYPTSMAAAAGFPGLRYTRAPYADNTVKGFPETEAMILPHGLDVNPQLAAAGGRVDSLYHYQSNALLERGSASFMDDGVTALRYSGPDQGRLIMCGFPLFWLPETEAVDLLEAGVVWLIADP